MGHVSDTADIEFVRPSRRNLFNFVTLLATTINKLSSTRCLQGFEVIPNVNTEDTQEDFLKVNQISGENSIT